ncbi:hypothetical protein DSM03_1183 [Leeuwenhoekiella aestuarii]|uniref:C1q domain-containing protein n=1 Tax=Leeuwenhoekiella aestuarii TaxID=2249426 RepID=A0A4Q0NNV3_9FLAO|nr:hypothetical protein [Leeuwenhoekiella aestuarii]RXG11335.1 hypothetical protein DSM03_1183 [Leeuwenhoekiella aestuarii]RXG11759.1 hypothetical protein DSM04_10985 [Leeuwenhoekiella aestuarii]
MKNVIPYPKIKYLVWIFLVSIISNAQVGIGTTSPSEGSLLDITSTDKGVLIPRVNIEDLSTQAPVTGNLSTSESLMVYNTNTTTGKGFYYWDGTQWVAIGASGENIYTTDGTLQTDRIVSQEDKTLDFEGNIGRNAIALKRTNNVTEVGLSFRNSGDFYDASIFQESGTNTGLTIATGGNQNDPTLLTTAAIFNNDQTTSFSKSIAVFEGDANTSDITGKLYSSNDDGILELNENNTYNHRIAANSTTIFNEKGLDLDLRIESNNETNALFIDGGSDRVGISQGTPQEKLHIGGTNSTIRTDGLSNANNAENVAGDPMPVYVDDNGTMVLQPSLVQTYMPVNEYNFTTGNTVNSSTGAGVNTTLYNTSITLSQNSLVFINYQFSVQLFRNDGSTITDGKPRLFRGWIEVDGDNTRPYGYDTGTYANRPDTNGTYANGFYYLSGSTYVQLTPGTHTINLFGRGFGGNFDFQIIFGGTNFDHFQVVVQR